MSLMGIVKSIEKIYSENDTDAFNQFGIKLYGEDGKQKSFGQVIHDMANRWATLNDKERDLLASIVLKETQDYEEEYNSAVI